MDEAATVGERLVRNAWSAVQLGYTLLWTAGWVSVALLLLAVSGNRRLALRMAARCWAPGLLWGSKVTVVGLERVDWSKPHLLVANHQSMIDICALFHAVPGPLHFLLKQEMQRVPFVGGYARATGMLFIDREDRRAGPRMRREAATLLRQGATLCLFPEGTRSRTGFVAPFKGGAFQSAIDAGAEVVPVALDGTGAVLPVDGFFRGRPGPIRVEFGAPLPVRDGNGPVDRQALAARAHAEVVALLRRPG
ncbi:MAG TPA: lysophospholipid acyltransferase family protein [Luteimonas sp.]|nr:lysophospholipid acyltransferase family protein [Luteimonas sp.]